jgi:3-hydroxy-3-methylglutaryl CoA synthase
MSEAVGIDDINLYCGPLTISYDTVARARGLSDRQRLHAQFVRRAVVPPFEDTVTLAVNAADALVADAGAESIGLLLVATESPIDYAIPVSTPVHHALGLPTACRHLEVKNACYAAASALQLAAAWVRSRAAAGRRALVISSDLAGRRAHHPSEMTAGEAAIAMVVGADPRVLVLDDAEGCAADDVRDICRPKLLQEAGDPMRSLSGYLDMLDLAWDEYRKQSGPVSFEDCFRYMAFHTPLVWLVRQAHRTLLQGDRPDASDDDVEASFRRMVEPSLRYTQLIGNAYSGCVFVSLLGVLDSLQERDSGARIGMFSYGSGASAEMLSGTVAPDARGRMARHRIEAALAARHEISVDELDAAAEAVFRGLTADCFQPDRSEPAWRFREAYQDRGLLVLDQVQNHFRTYVRS